LYRGVQTKKARLLSPIRPTTTGQEASSLSRTLGSRSTVALLIRAMRGFVLLLLPLGSLSMTCNVNATAKYYDAALAQLESKGYTFIKGDMRVTDIDTFGANPGNPYIIYEDLPGGEVDQGYWPLGLTDAVLLVTCTPTGVRYFSYRSYLFKGGGDGLVFASMGDSTNNLAIRTTTDDIIPALNGDPGNYAARAALVTTGDAQTYADISVALAYAGLANATNLDQVELSLFNGSTAYYTMLHRASVWSDENDRQAYFARHNPIYYVRAPERRAAKALPLSEQRPRGTGQSERDVNGLTEAFDQLKAGVVAHMLELGGAYNESIQCLSANLFGRDCIAENIQCLGDNPDTKCALGPSTFAAHSHTHAQASPSCFHSLA